MDIPPENGTNLLDATKRVLWRASTIIHNRAELAMVELQEQNERLHAIIFLACGIAILGLLGGITLTAVIALAAGSHILIALIILTVIYLGSVILCYARLVRLLRNSTDSFASSREQLKKDRECLEESLD